MKQTFDFRRTLTAMFILCGFISLSTMPVFADSGIRVHRAGQFHRGNDKQQDDNEMNRNNDNVELIKFLSNRHTHHKSSAKFQRPPVLDSRFPNSYRAYNDYQKSLSERQGN